MGDHLNVQLSWGDTIYLADLPQSTASGANEIVESTGQSKCLDLLTAQINPTGKIVEAGTHTELVEQGGIYADLWLRQSGGFIAEEEPDMKVAGE